MALQSLGDSIWLIEGDIVNFYGFAYPTRCVVIRLANRDLWVWSPVRLEAGTGEQIDRLGTVKHLVSPNKIHHLYLQEWKKRYPQANLWGPQSTIRKRRDLSFREPLESDAPDEWRAEIGQLRFHGSIFMDEIVFFHKASRTAIIADLSENFDDEFLRTHWGGWKRQIARLWKITTGYGYAPLELRLSWFRRRTARTALNTLLQWNPEQVIMAHGEWQRENGKAYLQQAFAWLN